VSSSIRQKGEQSMWRSLRPRMLPLDPHRIENSTEKGTPDVNYAHGWIELKYCKTWPKRAATPLRIVHFTKEQRAWLERREIAGGLSWVLLKVGESEWLLFRGGVAAFELGNVNKERLYHLCTARWTRLPNKEELISCLTPNR